jgi:peptidoglycan/LPS O-acetylase OafA/YrhL
MEITKDKSTLIKGIVIIMMIFYHLFDHDVKTDMCTNIFYIGSKPFALWLSNACNPVTFYLLLSGYGLSYIYYKNKSKCTFVQQAKRIFKLYVHYWLVLFLFLPIGFFMFPDKYPGSFLIFVLNASGWDTSYNGTMWFLFPYCLVSLSSSVIISTIERMGNKMALLLTGSIYFVVCYLISRHGEKLFFGHLLIYQPVLFLQFLYPFTLGAVFYRAGRSIRLSLPSWQAIVSIIILVSLVASFGNSIAYMVYVPLLVFLLCQLSYPKWLEIVFMELGRKSMTMWMVHAWFCYYLFQPQVYSLRYPFLILVGLVLISYLIAIPVMWIAKKLLRCLNLE